MADTGTLPIFGKSFMSRDVVGYRQHLPMPYSSTPPFEENGGNHLSALLRRASHGCGKSSRWSIRAGSCRATSPTGSPSHPPLYYAIMAPV
jgi:hypothetical protein